ncbi:MAG: hypothetical protein JW751_01990, partial [Polyangiaceae bacterium]|nr:hypothetical protein [Polyangiaceae bacterium]
IASVATSVSDAECIPSLVAESEAPRAEREAVADKRASRESSTVPSPIPAASPSTQPRTSATAGSSAVASDAASDELILRYGDRRWRVRGLGKNAGPETLKVNLLVSREGAGFHVDTLELYSARQRAHFVAQAALELGVEEQVIKRELGAVLLELENLLEKRRAESAAPEGARPKLSDEEREAALELLRDPRLLERILEDFERCGVVGERTNKLMGYLAATSRKLEAPLAVVIQSSSAAGKSSLMDAVLALMPEEERVQYSAMTGQSLFYLGETDIQHKILAIVEEEGAERASYALKLLQSEGELTIASTGKDPATGRLVTQEYRVTGPVMIFLTTTAIEVDEELLNRCLVLTVDEGREQTRAIHERQRAAETLEGMLAKAERAHVVKVHRDAQRLLRPMLVVNPFARELTFLDHATRTRRDHMKYLTLIRTIALLHQHQRAVRTVDHRGRRLEYLEVTREDIAVANRLCHEVLGRSLDELPPQTRRLLGLVTELVAEACRTAGLERRDFRFSRREVRERTGWGNTQLKLHLGRLVELELLVVHRGKQGQSYVYELAYDGEASHAGPHLAGLTAVGAGGAEASGASVADTASEAHPAGAASTTSTSRGSEGTSRGAGAEFAGGGRGLVGGRSGASRGDETPQIPQQSRSNVTALPVSGGKARPGTRRAAASSVAAAAAPASPAASPPPASAPPLGTAARESSPSVVSTAPVAPPEAG